MDEETRLVIKIMHLAYLVNQYTNYCVFIHFSGHVNSLEITIAESKKLYMNRVLTSEFSTCYKAWRDKDARPLIAELRERTELLERILTEHEIPFDDLNYEEVYERIYQF